MCRLRRKEQKAKQRQKITSRYQQKQKKKVDKNLRKWLPQSNKHQNKSIYKLNFITFLTNIP